MSTEPTYKGVVFEVLPATLFRVRLVDGREIIAHLAGKLRMNHIRITAGDNVTLILSPDGQKGRITFRN